MIREMGSWHVHPGLTVIGVTVLTSIVSPQGHAQQQEKKRATDVMLEEVVVTARKREEGAQDVPLSITAFGANQLDAMKLRDLNDLSVGIPNVVLEDIGTAKGIANFSIRGLGINSSIPSIDPTVGVFVDGVFMGTNAGVVFDLFDLDSIEVLRGPQGILFGRNVTGGALLIKTKKPGDELAIKAKTSLTGGGDGGLNRTVHAAVSGPLSDTFSAGLSLYYNDDEGYFENSFDGSDHGAVEQNMYRLKGVWQPTDDFELSFKYQYDDIDGEGPSGQNHTNGIGINPTLVPAFGGMAEAFDRDSFDFSIDEPGFINSETELGAVQADWQLGTGKLTYIFGYRDLQFETLSDIDATRLFIFNAATWTESKQYTNELRYNVVLGERANITLGVYNYENDLQYHERRSLPSTQIPNTPIVGIYQDGGGKIDNSSFAVFSAVDYDLNESWILTAGLRYTSEEKDARIASLNANVSAFFPGQLLPQGPACNIVLNGDCAYDFVDSKEWSNVSPKLGLTYLLSDNAKIFAHWTRGFRSGGYNLRNTADISTPELREANGPGPFDEEEVDSFEIGYKSTFEWGRLNAAAFYTQIDDMQREVNIASGNAVVQVVKNTADAEMLGLEVDAAIKVTDSLLMTFSAGWIDAEYDSVRFDISGDGVVDSSDTALDIPRVPELTYSIGFTHDTDLGDWGSLASRISYAYRDETMYTDNNLGFIGEQKILNAGIDYTTNGGSWVFSLFGKNLLDEVKHGGDTQLSFGTFSPLAKGRVLGVEVTYSF